MKKNINKKHLIELLKFAKDRLTPQQLWTDKLLCSKEQVNYEKRLYKNAEEILRQIKYKSSGG